MHLWDYILIIMVSLQVLVAAYLYDPKWKALMITLPFPFTFASLSVGQQVDAVNVLAMIAMFLFMQCVRVFYVQMGWPIFIAIGCAIMVYLSMGWSLSAYIPHSETWFWISCVLVYCSAIGLYMRLPVRQEPGDRTVLPIGLKLPLTVLLVTGLVWIKPHLLGSMTFFPMVGVFIAYEARKSLWTMGRQNTIVILTVLPMLVVVHMCYSWLGLGKSLLMGWPVFLLGLLIMRVIERRRLRGMKFSIDR